MSPVSCEAGSLLLPPSAPHHPTSHRTVGEPAVPHPTVHHRPSTFRPPSIVDDPQAALRAVADDSKVVFEVLPDDANDELSKARTIRTTSQEEDSPVLGRAASTQ